MFFNSPIKRKTLSDNDIHLWSINPQNIQDLTLLASLHTLLSPSEQQLLDLYHKTLIYFDLSRSMSLLLPEFDIDQVNSTLNINLAVDKSLQHNNQIKLLRKIRMKILK